MTHEAWVNPSTIGGSWRTVIFKERPGGMVYGLYAGEDAGRPGGFLFAGGQETSALGTSALPLNAWSHLAMTFDAGRIRLYVSGAQVSTFLVVGAMAPSTGALKIGGNGIWPEWFKGSIDEVRVYNRALSAAEIVTDRDRAVSP